MSSKRGEVIITSVKKVLPAIIIIIVLGSGFYLITRNYSSNPTPSQKTTQEVQRPTSGVTGQKHSLRSLLALGTSQICDFSDESFGSSGKIYIASNKIRGEIVTLVNGETVSSHIYSDGSDMYLWMEDADTGYKSSISSQTGHPRIGIDIDQEVDFQCREHQPDMTLFELPSGITFRDLQSLF